jgi:hypothetical protein
MMGWGQVLLTNGTPSITIDFSNTTQTSVGSNPSTAFNGSGFEANPTTVGRLNSNAWAVTGWTDGALTFGGTRNTASTDYTRGTASAAVTTGGIYAYTGTPQSAANPCIMIQPGGGDWAPGTLTLRIQNNGTTNITQLTISYNLYVRNDQARSNSFNFSHSSDDVTYTNVSALDYTSIAASDLLGWVLVGTAPSRSTTITGLNIAPSAFYYIRWSGADVGGSGSRDEFGLDDIAISATFVMGTPPPTLTADITDNTVDNSIDITFTDDITWRAAVSAVKINGNAITSPTDYELTAGQLRLKPSGLNTNLTTSGSKTVTVEATGYSIASVTQVINHGAKNNLSIQTEPTAPAMNADALATQPVIQIRDQYNNICTSDNSSTVTAAVGAGTWTLAGTATIIVASGIATFAGLTATSSAAVTGATIVFSSTGLGNVTSSTFNIPAPNQIDFINFIDDYIQDFNTLANTGTSSSMPIGWFFSESGSNANSAYTAGTGSSTTGDTYSYGAASSSERALGGLQSGSLIPTLGAKIVNKTGLTITSLSIEYTGEQWRLGATGREDRLDFQYSTDATSLTTGTWTDVNDLDFIAPVTSGTTGELDGNATANKRTLTGNVIVNIPNNGTLWIRWTDFNATSSDDGLAIDDVIIHPYAATRLANTTISAGTYNNLNIVGTVSLDGDVTVERRIKFNNGALLDLNGHMLTVNGTFRGTSNIRGSTSSSLVINGSGTLGSDLSFVSTTNRSTNALRHLTINRSGSTVTLSNALYILGTLTVNDGTLATAGNLTLVSSATDSARVAELGAGASITGNVTAERYIPAVARRWRFLTPTVSGSTLNDWKNEIFIIGPGGSTNGFDATGSGSVFTYNESATGTRSNGWITPSNTSASLQTGLGYRTFIYGDRSDPNRITGVNNTQNAVTISTVGPLHTGNIDLPVSFTSNAGVNDDGWNLVGNPYHSGYDWNHYYDNCTGCYNNIQNTVWVFDAGFNNYKSYNATTNSGTLTNGILPIGAAFWVKANASSPTLQFREQYKTGAAYIGMFKNGIDELKLEMRLDATNADEFILKHLDSSSAGYDLYDITKMNGAVNMMSVTSNNTALTLDCRPVISNNDTVQLFVNGANGNYTITTRTLPANTKFYYLVDRNLNTTTLLAPLSNYTFSIQTSDTTSFGRRFYIIISNSGTLPVEWKSFSAKRSNNITYVKWSTATEMNASHYEVQRSSDNQIFETIGKVWARNTNNNDYEFRDEAVLKGIHYYRIKQVDADYTTSYTHVIPVNCDEAAGKITILNAWPTVVDTRFNISLGNDSYTMDVYDVNGQLKYNGTFAGDNYQLNASGWSAGVYFVQLKSNTNGNTATLRFIKQ